MLSLRWLLCHLFMSIYTNKTKKIMAYWWLALFCLWLWAITLLQQYPRHIVTSLRWISFDIKQYVLVLMALFFTFKQIQTQTPPTETPEVIAL
jgi:hypothetical protein